VLRCVGYYADGRFARLQASLQYFTCSQSRAHFLRQVNGRPQWAQVRTGKFALATPRMGLHAPFDDSRLRNAAAAMVIARRSVAS
jgi:hypothetical protein